jgi:ribosome maturation factor RimP
MSTHEFAKQVAARLRGPLSDMDVDLEDVEVSKAGRRHVVRVVVDRDGGIDLDLVAEVSRLTSEILDSPEMAEQMPGAFVLEVTSPGVDRPLTEERHWRRAVGRLVETTLADGSVVVGRVLTAPTDGEVTISTEAGDRTVVIAEVTRAVVQVEFSRIDEE